MVHSPLFSVAEITRLFLAKNRPSKRIGTPSPSIAVAPPRAAWMCRCGSLLFAWVANLPEDLTLLHQIPCLDSHTALHHVRQNDIDPVAGQQDVIAGHVLSVALRDHVGQSIHRLHDPSLARAGEGVTEDRVAGEILRIQTDGPGSQEIEFGDIQRITAGSWRGDAG